MVSEIPHGTNGDAEQSGNGLEFWSNIPRDPTDTILIVVTHLRNRGAAIDVLDQATIPTTHQVMPDHVAVYVSSDAKRLIEESLDLPEVTTIRRAYEGALHDPRPEEDQHNRTWLNAASHNWDEATQRRVEALYWTNTAATWRDHIQYQKGQLHKPWHIRHPLHIAFYFMERQEVKDTQQTVRRCEALARKALGDLPPVTPEDTRTFIESAIDQYLSSTGRKE